MPAKGLKNGESKYKETMPAQLIEMFTRGKDRCHFCAHHSISEKTFSMWIEKHQEFSEAYEVAKSKAKTYLLEIADNHLIEEHEGPKLNTKLWSMLMRNRFEMTEHRKLKIEGLKKAQNFADQMKLVMAELADGNLTGSEAQQLAKLIETGVNIYEATELEKRVAQIEQAAKIGATDSDFKEEADANI